jgi:hypothetical protein
MTSSGLRVSKPSIDSVPDQSCGVVAVFGYAGGKFRRFRRMVGDYARVPA